MTTKRSASVTSTQEARPTSYADQVYGSILADISAGAFEHGSKLPSEKQLGERFSVSRPVIRDALARLQRDGLVASRRGSGSFVLSAPPEDLSAAADLAQIARYQRFQEFRLVVEGAAAALAAERRTEQDLKRILASHERLVREIEGGTLLWQSDRDLHLSIAMATGNDFFAASLEGPEIRLRDFMSVSLKLTSSRSDTRRKVVAEEHSAIVAGIVSRDPVASRVAMEHHLLQAQRRMLDRNLSP